jgi:hypothetical protein
MVHAFILQHIVKITAVILTGCSISLWKTRKPKKTDMDILLQKLCDIEDRINNRGF